MCNIYISDTYFKMVVSFSLRHNFNILHSPSVINKAAKRDAHTKNANCNYICYAEIIVIVPGVSSTLCKISQQIGCLHIFTQNKVHLQHISDEILIEICIAILRAKSVMVFSI